MASPLTSDLDPSAVRTEPALRGLAGGCLSAPGCACGPGSSCSLRRWGGGFLPRWRPSIRAPRTARPALLTSCSWSCPLCRLCASETKPSSAPGTRLLLVPGAGAQARLCLWSGPLPVVRTPRRAGYRSSTSSPGLQGRGTNDSPSAGSPLAGGLAPVPDQHRSACCPSAARCRAASRAWPLGARGCSSSTHPALRPSARVTRHPVCRPSPGGVVSLLSEGDLRGGRSPSRPSGSVREGGLARTRGEAGAPRGRPRGQPEKGVGGFRWCRR